MYINHRHRGTNNFDILGYINLVLVVRHFTILNKKIYIIKIEEDKPCSLQSYNKLNKILSKFK